MIVVMETNYAVIDDNKLMIMSANYENDCNDDDKLCCYWRLQDDDNHEDDCDPEVELFCYWLLQVDDNMANDDNDSDCWCRAIVLMMTMMTNHED